MIGRSSRGRALGFGGPASFGAFARMRRFGKFEVDLFFEAIDFRDLHFDPIAHFDDAAGASADDNLAVGVKGVKVVGQGGKGDKAAHGEVRDIHEEAEVSEIGDERGIAEGLAGAELGIEEGVKLHIFAVAFGIGGIALGGGDVIGGFSHRVFAE